jgi:hypothetical protein
MDEVKLLSAFALVLPRQGQWNLAVGRVNPPNGRMSENPRWNGKTHAPRRGAGINPQ